MPDSDERRDSTFSAQHSGPMHNCIEDDARFRRCKMRPLLEGMHAPVACLRSATRMRDEWTLNHALEFQQYVTHGNIDGDAAFSGA